MTWWEITLATVAAALILVVFARQAADEYFRRHPARIGRLSDVLPGWNQHRCAHCRTSYRYVEGHPLTYEGRNERGYPVPVTVVALCNPCHHELSPGQRAPYYLSAFEWMNQGHGYDRREEIALRAAIEVGA